MQHQTTFINLAVEDTDRSRAFYTAVGYEFDERMCQDGTALSLVIGPHQYAMLLKREFFDHFHNGTAATPGQHEMLLCVSCDSKDEVNQIVDAAIAAGGREIPKHPDTPGQDEEYMFGRSYADPDGHIWEVMWMDMQGASEAGVFTED